MNGSVSELLDRCRSAGLSLAIEEEALCVDFEREPPDDLIEKLRQCKPEVMAALCGVIPSREPLTLRDGRIMWRFLACEVPASISRDTVALLDRVRRAGVVFVADGLELHVVERWKGQLRPNLLRALRDNAGASIAVLRGEHRARMTRLPPDCVAEYDARSEGA